MNFMFPLVAFNGIVASYNGMVSESNQITEEFDGIGFSGSGYLTNSHFQIISDFYHQGIDLSTFKVAGSSGGAWAAAMACSRQNISYVMNLFDDMINNPNPPSIHDDVEPIIHDFCDKIVPLGDGWKNCNGKLEVTVTKVKYNCAVDEAMVIDNFPSREVLVNALVASSFVVFPIISPKCYMIFDDSKHKVRVKDGYFTDTLPCPRNSKNCLSVSAIPKQLSHLPFFGKGNRGNPDIYPGLNGELPMPLLKYFGAFLDNRITKKYNQEIKNGATKDFEYYMKNKNRNKNIRVVPS